MHETGIAMEVLRLARETAEREGAARIARLKVVVGRWSGVEPETLRFALETLLEGPVLEGARVDMEVREAEFLCGHCGERFPAQGYFDPCPACGREGAEMVAGDELLLEELDVEDG
ncbi:hydrogenase maturation nickel metallochaperone HypA/HybF [Deferrisoma sp.]